MNIHHKDQITVDLTQATKRHNKTYNCPELKIEKHLKEHVHGKTLSPERKIVKMNHNKVKEEDAKEVAEKKKELENLQNLILQTRKEKEEVIKRLSNANEKVLNLKKTNSELRKETEYLKVENQQSFKNMNDLDKEYTIQLKELKRSEVQKKHEIIFLKAENEKHTRDINKLDSV